MTFPSTIGQLLEAIARETARMSYPGRMSGGRKPIVRKGTKKILEEYFATKFPMLEMWRKPSRIASRYDEWHRERVLEMARLLRPAIASEGIKAPAVASKFLNTFTHQLMKYERCRSLWPHLQLPLDARVFRALSRRTEKSLQSVSHHFTRSPYRLSYPTHSRIQNALVALVDELNQRADAEFVITSRIELNWLWV